MSDKIDEKLADVEETIDTSAETTENTGNTIEDIYKQQEDLINDNTEFAIQQIEQQKAETKKEYEKEQSNAYRDYMHATNPYGTNAEQMAASGLRNSGYSESAKVAMFNQYQNRLMAAREIYASAVQKWDAEITRAKIQNRSDLAKIAIDAMKSSFTDGLGFAVDGLNYGGETKTDASTEGKTYQDVLDEIIRTGSFQNTYQQMMDEGIKKGKALGDFGGIDLDDLSDEGPFAVQKQQLKDAQLIKEKLNGTINMDSLEAAGLSGMSASEVNSTVQNTESAWEAVANRKMTPAEFNRLAKTKHFVAEFVDAYGRINYVKINSLDEMIQVKEMDKSKE